MAEWRLFTRRDFRSSGFRVKRNGKSATVDVERFRRYLKIENGRTEPSHMALATANAHDSNDRSAGRDPSDERRQSSVRILGDENDFSQGVLQLWRRLFRDKGRSLFEHGAEHGIESKIPRAHKWRAYRLTEHGALLAILVLKNSEAFNLCEVDAFLATEHPQLAPGAVVEAMMLFMLSDAVKCGGSMAVQFTGKCFGKRVPPPLVDLAQRMGVPLQHVRSGAIAPDEARQLYLKLTRFSDEAERRIVDLASRGKFSIERVCYLVHHGIWKKEEVDGMLLGSPFPEAVLSGTVHPEDGHVFTQAMFHARAAILGQILCRAFAREESCARDDSDAVVERGGYERPVEYQFKPQLTARVYRSNGTSLELSGWCADGSTLHVPAHSNLTALLRPHDATTLATFCQNDIQSIVALAGQWDSRLWAVVVPFEFHLRSTAERQALIALATSHNAKLLVCPEKNGTLQKEANRRIQQGEFIRK